MSRRDLTRWNRAGLSRFDYVDGNAPVFLEHLRAAMIAKFSRGLPASDEARDPDYWFDFLRDANHPVADAPRMAALADALDWDDLARGLPPLFPGTPESKSARNRRLMANYDAESEDYAAEMMRAAARAAHVLAGYINAYMNEGYLATATQWSSLARLGEMVNYAPAPAASASTTVALTVKPESGVVTVPRGLAMSAPPPEGGAPVIFETLSDITCHAALNEVRERRWHVNRDVMTLAALNDWNLAGEKAPDPGSLVLIAPGKFREPSAKAGIVAQSRVSPDGQSAGIALQAEPEGKWRKGYAEMWSNPEGSARGMIVDHPDMTVVTVEDPGALQLGGIVEFLNGRQGTFQAVVNHIEGNRVGLTANIGVGEITAVRPMIPYSVEFGYFDHPSLVTYAYFNKDGRVFAEWRDLSNDIYDHTKATTGRVVADDGTFIAYRFACPGATWGGVPNGDGAWINAAPLNHPPSITDALHDANTIVPFAGKPPKSLKAGDYYIARGDDDALTALRVRGFRADDGIYHIAFNKPPEGAFEQTTFLGPLRSVIRPKDHDRSTASIIDADGTVTLAGLPDDAKALIQVGKRLIIEDKRETGEGPVSATVQKICDESGDGQKKAERDQVKIVLASIGFDLSAFVAGHTVFRFNTLSIGHGETKPGKTLGSGNGELARQSLHLDVKGVTFTADAQAATGVRADIDVAVDGTIWEPADLTDPSVEGTDRYSVRTRDDDTLDIVFRRRLPTGRNNIRVSRHRVGAGRKGNGIGPLALTKPKSKHKHVTAVHQPFATAGGADRESTESIRENAGAAIAANNRAVSLQDYTRLAQRHASIWDARAVEVIHPGRAPEVAITIVPVDGVEITEQLPDLESYIQTRALPGSVVTLHHFTPVPVTLAATIRADFSMVTEDQVLEAATAALTEGFALINRRLGQSLFVAEVLAVLEGLRGVVTATASLGLGPEVVPRTGLTFTSGGGVVRAIHPGPAETAFVVATSDIAITVEPAS